MTRLDSNQRPSRYERAALPTKLRVSNEPIGNTPMGSTSSDQDALESSVGSIVEPSVRFELTCPYGTGLQIQCNRPLCEEGVERDRLFIPLRDSLRPVVREDGFEPPTPVSA